MCVLLRGLHRFLQNESLGALLGALAREGERAAPTPDGKVCPCMHVTRTRAPLSHSALCVLNVVVGWAECAGQGGMMGTAVLMLEAIVTVLLQNRDRCEVIWPAFHQASQRIHVVRSAWR
jgi:hypothetical protein